MRHAIVTVAALACALAVVAARADDVDPATHEHAVRIAVGTCGACHGANGVSKQPKYPRLAAQNANYLAAQLKAFRAQTRGDADAISYMWGMAAQLEDGTIEALAQYYASQPAGAPLSGDPALTAKGREIYEKGVAAVGVPACSACHGADGHGTADFPRLAGQH
ncbi:MAG: cytochrome c4, partial [Proteobacteria bacterium]|nr:cytochrome c4 [Pseudomonadota bacterium]